MSRKCLKFLLVVGVLGAAAQAEYLTNGGFESGDLTGWWTYLPDDVNQSVSIDVVTVYEGTYSAKMTSNVGGEWAQLGQTIDIGAGIDYDFSLAYNITDSNVATASAGYYLEFQDNNWDWIDGVWVDLYDTGGSWATTSTSGTTVAGTEHLIVKLMTGDTTTTYYDAVSLTPEPTTIALLALGGLAFRRRKRA